MAVSGAGRTSRPSGQESTSPPAWQACADGEHARGARQPLRAPMERWERSYPEGFRRLSAPPGAVGPSGSAAGRGIRRGRARLARGEALAVGVGVCRARRVVVELHPGADLGARGRRPPGVAYLWRSGDPARRCPTGLVGLLVVRERPLPGRRPATLRRLASRVHRGRSGQELPLGHSLQVGLIAAQVPSRRRRTSSGRGVVRTTRPKVAPWSSITTPGPRPKTAMKSLA